MSKHKTGLEVGSLYKYPEYWLFCYPIKENAHVCKRPAAGYSADGLGLPCFVIKPNKPFMVIELGKESDYVVWNQESDPGYLAQVLYEGKTGWIICYGAVIRHICRLV